MRNKAKLKKNITFIYMDDIERGMYEPIAREAERRGYKVKLTDNKFEKCEIGVYCQHRNFPQFSKFSVIMLHDIIQQHSRWPDIWFLEPWNKYDVGVLPSETWVDNWNVCSERFYTVPKKGMYLVGWPKADKIAKIDPLAYKQQVFKTYGLDLNKKTVIYAPSWENDGKQDDFVQAMLPLDVNILVKQYASASGEFPIHAKNVDDMYQLHKDNPYVTILNPKINIFEAIAISDVLVSDESSTMCEATMMGIPAVSVEDWPVLEQNIRRLPECDYDFVTRTKKDNLSNCIENIIKNYDIFKTKAEEYGKKNFANFGSASRIFMDIIDSYVNHENCIHPMLFPKKRKHISFKEYVSFKYICFKREVYYNYCQRCWMLGKVWDVLRFIKHNILHSYIQ